MSTYFIAVYSGQERSGDVLSRLERYLYDHTKIKTYAVPPWTDKPRLYAILETTADTDERAAWLADYQSGRLQSGSFFSSPQSSVENCKFILNQLANRLPGMFEIVGGELVQVEE